MTPQQKISAIRLSQKIEKNTDYSKTIGIEAIYKKAKFQQKKGAG